MSSPSSVTPTEQFEKCWYTRRDGVMRGPFSAENISCYLLLGRIRLTDELSQDCVSWSVARQFADLLPLELARQSSWDDYEQLVIAHMKADERSSERRRKNARNYLGSHAERRTIPDRRGGGDSMLSRYLFAGALSYEEKRPDSGRLRVLLLMMLLASLLFAWLNPIQQ